MQAWYDHVGEMDCWGCGGHPVERAHFKALISQKTGLRLGRRNGINEWAVMPLCSVCHRTGENSIHAIGEPRFFKIVLERSRCEVIRMWASMFTAFIAENAALNPRKR